MSEFTEIAKALSFNNPGPLDKNRGPYATLADACDAIPNVTKLVDGVVRNLREGKIVDIGIVPNTKEYRWIGGFSNNDLQPNTSDQFRVKQAIIAGYGGEGVNGASMSADKSQFTFPVGYSGVYSYFQYSTGIPFAEKHLNKTVRFEFVIKISGQLKQQVLAKPSTQADYRSFNSLLSTEGNISYYSVGFDLDIKDTANITPQLQFLNADPYTSVVVVSLLERVYYIIKDSKPVSTKSSEQLAIEQLIADRNSKLSEDVLALSGSVFHIKQPITASFGGEALNGAVFANNKASLVFPAGVSGNYSYFQSALTDFNVSYNGKRVVLEYLIKVTGILKGSFLAKPISGVHTAFSKLIQAEPTFSVYSVGFEMDIISNSGSLQFALQFTNTELYLAEVTVDILDRAFYVARDIKKSSVKDPDQIAIENIVDQKIIDNNKNSTSIKTVISVATGGEALQGASFNAAKTILTIPAGFTGTGSYFMTSMNAAIPGFNSKYDKRRVKFDALIKTTGGPLNGNLNYYNSSGAGVINKPILIKTKGNQYFYNLYFEQDVLASGANINPAIQISNSVPYSAETKIELVERTIADLGLVSDEPTTLRSNFEVALASFVLEKIAEAQSQSGEINTVILRAKKNGIVGVDCEFNGNFAISNAIDSIKDNGPLKRYVIKVFDGSYEYLLTADFKGGGITSGAVCGVRGKSYVSILGTGSERCFIKGQLPDNLTPSVYKNFQTVYWHSDFGSITGVSITGQNLRYPVHIDLGFDGNKNFYSLFRDVVMEHYGNTGNASGAAGGWGSPHPFGIGTSSGQKIELDSVTLKGPNDASYAHNNYPFEAPSSFIHRNCRLENTGTNKVVISLQSLGSGLNDLASYIGCSFSGGYFIDHTDSPWIPTTLEGQSYNHANYRIKGFGNGPFIYRATLSGDALRITSKSTGASSSVRFDPNSSAYPLIIKDKDYAGGSFKTQLGEINTDGYAYRDGDIGLAGYAIGRLDIGSQGVGGDDNNKIYIKSLGKRLGDCSVNNKTLTVVIDGISYNIVFNKNYVGAGTSNLAQSAYTNAQIIAEINAVIGNVATIKEWAVGKDYFPEFTDFVNNFTATEPILNGMVVVSDAGKIRKAKSTDLKITGVALDDIRTGDTGRVLVKGYISVNPNLRFFVSTDTNWEIAKGDQLGVSTNIGKINKTVANKIFTCFDMFDAYGLVSFNL